MKTIIPIYIETEVVIRLKEILKDSDKSRSSFIRAAIEEKIKKEFDK